MTYLSEVKALASLCKRCEGKCCFGKRLSVSEKELARLSKKRKFESAILSSKEGSLNVILFKDGKCPFLEVGGKTGCILSGRSRPLSCRLFPLTFLYKDGKLDFYSSSYCPYRKEAMELHEWVGRTMKEARKELGGWKEGEKRFRSNYHEKIHKKKRMVGL